LSVGELRDKCSNCTERTVQSLHIEGERGQAVPSPIASSHAAMAMSQPAYCVVSVMNDECILR
jgi:hypothetical protein